MSTYKIFIQQIMGLEARLKDLQDQIDKKNSIQEVSEVFNCEKDKTYFRLSYIAKENTLVNVYLNGSLLFEGENNDYILLERKHIIMMFTPCTADKITVQYKV